MDTHSVQSILDHHIENQPLKIPETPPAAMLHDNIRGAAYFDSTLQ
jgi:hypothetical protein